MKRLWNRRNVFFLLFVFIIPLGFAKHSNAYYLESKAKRICPEGKFCLFEHWYYQGYKYVSPNIINSDFDNPENYDKNGCIKKLPYLIRYKASSAINASTRYDFYGYSFANCMETSVAPHVIFYSGISAPRMENGLWGDRIVSIKRVRK